MEQLTDEKIVCQPESKGCTGGYYLISKKKRYLLENTKLQILKEVQMIKAGIINLEKLVGLQMWIDFSSLEQAQSHYTDLTDRFIIKYWKV